MVVGQWLLVGAAVCVFPLLSNLARCYRAILNDARIISLDPALQGNFEILYAYPGMLERMANVYGVRRPISSPVWCITLQYTVVTG